MWRARYGHGGGPSLRTLQRAFDRELRPGDRAAVVDGAEGKRRHQVYLRWEACHRNEIWEADYKELEVLVRPPRCRRGQEPWVTMFLDAYGRLIMGWAIWTFPSAPSVLAALGKAIRLDPERGPFGGVPLTLRPDNGLEIRCGLARQGRRCACCTLAPTRAYSPHLKGKLERANRTVAQEFVAGLPFYTDGPRTIDGRLYGPNTSPMTLEQFVEKFDRWVRAHCLLLVRQAVQQQ